MFKIYQTIMINDHRFMIDGVYEKISDQEVVNIQHLGYDYDKMPKKSIQTLIDLLPKDCVIMIGKKLNE